MKLLGYGKFSGGRGWDFRTAAPLRRGRMDSKGFPRCFATGKMKYVYKEIVF